MADSSREDADYFVPEDDVQDMTRDEVAEAIEETDEERAEAIRNGEEPTDEELLLATRTYVTNRLERNSSEYDLAVARTVDVTDDRGREASFTEIWYGPYEGSNIVWPYDGAHEEMSDIGLFGPNDVGAADVAAVRGNLA